MEPTIRSVRCPTGHKEPQLRQEQTQVVTFPTHDRMQRVIQYLIERVPIQTTVHIYVTDSRLDGTSSMDHGFESSGDALSLYRSRDSNSCDFHTSKAFVLSFVPCVRMLLVRTSMSLISTTSMTYTLFRADYQVAQFLVMRVKVFRL